MSTTIPKRKRILGMNKRSLSYLRPSNKKKYVHRADDKFETKKMLKKAVIPTTNLFAIIRDRRELLDFDWDKLPESFVLKPNMGFGGEGVIIVYGRKKNGNMASAGKEISKDDLVNHVSNILDGNFSLANLPDSALIEERIKLTSFMKPYTFKGIPDVRIVVYNNVPIMAMLRLPTKKSGGKANLHQGGIGVGIDIAEGITTHAVVKGFILEKEIDNHPDTKAPLRGIKIPNWKEVLEIAIKAAMASKLGYSGIDIAFDKDKGPLILEINARPGLSIQVANLTPLDDRLRRVKGLKVTTPERGVKIAQDLFGGEVEHELEEISGKEIIGLVENVKLIGKDNKEIEIEAKIDTGADFTSIDTSLAQELGYNDVVSIFHHLYPSGHLNTMTPEEIIKLHKDIVDVKTIYSSHGETQRMLIPLTFYLANIKIITKATLIERKNLTYKMIVGNKNLSKFLIDASKMTPQNLNRKKRELKNKFSKKQTQ